MAMPAEHLVQFYDRDEDLVELVSAFVRDGLSRRERVILLTSGARWRGIQTHLEARPDLAITAALDAGQVVVRDTAEMEHLVIADGTIDPAAFRAVLAESIGTNGDRVRVFGDFVSWLASRDMIDATLEIEQLGHELAHTMGAPVMCAYDMRQLPGPAAISKIAQVHDGTIGPTPPASQRPLVLLADDFADARDLYKDVLELSGFSVVTADDGVEAVEEARRTNPALIVLDIRMPRMSGLDAMRTLKADALLGVAPMVALTAHAFPADQSMLLAAGFDAVLTKPCPPDTLIHTIEALLGISSRA